MNDYSSRHSAVLFSIDADGVQQQSLSILVGQMWLSVIFAQLSLSSFHYHAFSAFIENLRHAREKAITIE